MGTTIAIIAVMLLFSAFFSGMEIAFLGRNRLREEIDRNQFTFEEHKHFKKTKGMEKYKNRNMVARNCLQYK